LSEIASLDAMNERRCARHHDQSAIRFAFEGSNGVLYLAAVLVVARAERSISAA